MSSRHDEKEWLRDLDADKKAARALRDARAGHARFQLNQWKTTRHRRRRGLWARLLSLFR